MNFLYQNKCPLASCFHKACEVSFAKPSELYAMPDSHSSFKPHQSGSTGDMLGCRGRDWRVLIMPLYLRFLNHLTQWLINNKL